MSKIHQYQIFSNIQKIIQSLSLIVISSVFGLLGCEILSRILVPEFNTSIDLKYEKRLDDDVSVGKPFSSYRQKKNTGDYNVNIEFNSLGLRDSIIPSQADQLSWIALGDSTTFGHGISEGYRFSDILREEFDIPTVNVASPTDFEGYITLLNYIKASGSKLNKLIIGASMETDIKNYESRFKNVGRSDAFVKFKRILTKYSTAYNYITTAVHTDPNMKAFAIKIGFIKSNSDGIFLTDYNIDSIKSSANKVVEVSQGYDTIVLLIPSRKLWIGSKYEKDIALKIHNKFIELLISNDLIVVDMKKILEKEIPIKYYFKNDGHWNNDGHRAAAIALRNEILKYK